MNFGYFDVDNKEYVITRPDTPTPWMNYLGNGGFSGMISNNAGGLLFDGDPGNRRLTRYKYNSLPVDRPGRYLYIRDMETGEYWSATWQPVMKPYEFYECRHGLGYTTIKTQTSGIETEITYYIPEGKKYEIWNARIINKSGRPRKLKLFSYIEFSHFNAHVDVNAEWARYEMLAECVDDIIICDAAVEVCPTGIMYGIMGTNLSVDGYDCYRDQFIGAYRCESNPIVVERGQSLNTHVGADQICGSLSSSMELASEEQKDFIFTVGIVDDKAKAKALVEEATDQVQAAAALAQIKASWEKHLLNCQIETPDADMNKMINIWHAYQCKMTFDWSRFISYYERGIVRGWGFRDSMQDVLGVMHALAPLAKERIKTLLSIQRKSGNARSVYYPATKKSEGGDRSDDHIWSIFSVCTYIRETGDYAFLNEMVPWEDGGEATVVEHLIQGLNFTRENVGDHGIPNFLNSDWNDSICAINKEGKAESVFVFFQAAHAAYELKLLFKHIGDVENLAWAEDYYNWCRDTYNILWDGKWFLRAFLSTGEKYGTDEDEENKIFLNPQSWAVLSRLPSPEQGNSAFDEVYKRLFCEFGLISHAPASSKYFPEKKSFMDFPRGIKENGGVFCHANTWAVIAETLLGRNNEAYEIYRASLPCRRGERAEQTLIEPYVYGSAQLGPDHERFGAGSNSWLTGTASWMYFAATQHILGFRPDYDGIIIDPCIPDSWDGFKMKRNYRGTECMLTVGKRPAPNAKVKALLVDGKRIEGNFLSAKLLEGKKQVRICAVYQEKRMNPVEDFILNNWDATIRFNPNDEGTCIGLPKPYTVPCISEKFQEMYYWDTYFTNVGLILSGYLEQAKNNVENVAYLIQKFGHMPNGSRTYYLSRSQPPFFSQMVRDVYEQTQDKVWLAEMYGVVEKEYQFWMEKRLTDTGLNRYYGNLEKLHEDVALELTQRFGIDAPQTAQEHEQYTKCMQAFCESGWDCTSRFGLQAHLYNPVDLNALLYGVESNMAFFGSELGKPDCQFWTDRAKVRKDTMVRLLWDSNDGCYYDYQFEVGKRGKVVSAAAFYPLMFGAAEPEYAAQVVKKLSVLEQEYGIAATAYYPDNLELQWDYPHGWACLQYIVISGLRRYGYCKEAYRIAQKYCAVVEKNYATTQNIWEKYDTVSGGISVTKEYESPQMMGWSAGVYLYCRKILENE